MILLIHFFFADFEKTIKFLFINHFVNFKNIISLQIINISPGINSFQGIISLHDNIDFRINISLQDLYIFNILIDFKDIINYKIIHDFKDIISFKDFI